MGHCHCSMCRKHHGAAFSTALAVHPSRFRWLRGVEGIRRYESSPGGSRDRKSTRLNSSHGYISYAVFCLKKKKTKVNACPLTHNHRHATPASLRRSTDELASIP